MGGILIIKVVLFFRFGHQGASLFSKPNTKMAVSGIIRGQNGMKLSRVGPLPLVVLRFGKKFENSEKILSSKFGEL